MADPDEPVIGNSEVKELEERVRELELILERMTQENHFLSEALAKAYKNRSIPRPNLLPEDGAAADVLDVSLSKFAQRLKGKSEPSAP